MEEAALALGELGDARAVGPLARLVRQGHGKSEEDAMATALVKLCAVNELVGLLGSDLTSIRVVGVMALHQGFNAWKSESVRETSSLILSRGYVERYLEALAQSGEYVFSIQRAQIVARRFGEVMRGHEQAVEPIFKALRNMNSWQVVVLAASALGRLGDVSAVEPLIETLGDKLSFAVREASAEALGRLGDPKAVGALQAAMRDSHEEVSAAASRALTRMGFNGQTLSGTPGADIDKDL
jgi:HEAT repeat protein